MSEAFMHGLVDELEKCGARIYMQGKEGLFPGTGPKGDARSYISYIPDKTEKEIFHQPDVRRNIADALRTLKKKPGAGSAFLATPTSKRETKLTREQAIKALRKRGKHFARGPAGKMEAISFRIGKKK